VDLQDFEVPTSVRFGGNYRLAVHRLSSGRRIIEQLGPDDTEIRFAGTFAGPQADDRVRDMNNLRLSGQSTWLTWGTFRSRIIIKTFSADYRSPWWIPYQISCLVTHQPGTFQSAPADGAALLALDLSAALSLVAGTGIPLTSLQTALNGESASVPGTSDQAQATSAVQSSLASCDSVIAQTSSELSALPTNPSQATTYSTTFVAAVGSAGSLAAAVNAQAYISRIGNNLQGNAD
jgi:hypothetical protein